MNCQPWLIMLYQYNFSIYNRYIKGKVDLGIWDFLEYFENISTALKLVKLNDDFKSLRKVNGE